MFETQEPSDIQEQACDIVAALSSDNIFRFFFNFE